MPYTVPNSIDATYPQQARLDSRDLDMVNGAMALTGVISGCAVTAQGSPNMTVAVAAGVVRIAGRKVVVTAANSGTFGAADGTNPRIDLVTITTAGAITIVAGTAAATPTIPTIPASRVVLARVDIPAAATTVTTGQIVDKRVVIAEAAVENVKWYGALGDGRTVTDGAMTNASATLTSATAAFTAADVGKAVHVARAISASPVELYTTIASVTNATTAVVALAPAFTTTARTFVIGSGRTVADGVTTADSTTVTSATAAFTAADVGTQIRINAVHSVALSGTISAYTNATTVTLSTTCTRTVTGASTTYGTNDTQAFITALEICRDYSPTTCFVPEGIYLLERRKGDSTCVLLYSNTTLRGEGWGSILRDIGGQPPDASATSLIGVNSWDRGTVDPAANVTNVTIENLQIAGTTIEDGFHQWSHLVQVNAGSDISFRGVKFYNFRGDACYIGSGSSIGTLERHNQRIRWEDCLWDGGNRDNRNGISFIDVDDATVTRCTFKNLARANMPGAIDIEPNSANIFPVIRGIRIDNCYFSGVGGDSGTIGMNIPIAQSVLTNPMRGYNITNCVFTAPAGASLCILLQQQQYPVDSTPRSDILISGNWFYDYYSIGEIEGCRGVEIDNNFFINASANLDLGYSFKCADVSIINNVFKSCGWFTSYVVAVYQALRVNIDRNYFENCGVPGGVSGDLVRFTNGQGAGTYTLTVTPQGATGATTRGYRYAAIRDQTNFKTTLASGTVQITNSNATLSVTNFNRLSWTPDYQPGGFRIYGRTSGSELLMATVGPGIFTWDDTGAVTPSGALPGADTSAQGNTDSISFTNNVVRQGQSALTVNIASVAANHTTIPNNNTYANNQQPGLGLSTAYIDSTITYTSAATVTIDASLVPPRGTVQILLGATANTTTTITNPVKGQIITFDWVQDATGSRTWTNPTNLKLSSTAWTHNTVALKHDSITARYDGTNWYEISRALIVG